MRKIKIALLGIGRIGKIHFRNINRHFPHAEVVAVADAQLSHAEFKKEYGHVFFSNRPEEAIAFPEAEAVLICTPTCSHAALIERAAMRGKHIFCEKPMDLSLEITAALTRMIESSGVKLMLGFNRRFDPDFMQAKKSIEEGKIGEVQMVKITSRDPGLPPLDYIKNSGGLFMDMAIHDFDMARHITGKEATEVFSKGSALIDDAVSQAGDIDTALTVLTFEGGACAVIDNSRKAIYGYDQRIEVFGSGGMIQVENILRNRNTLYNEHGIHQALPLDFFMDRYAESYLREMELFIRALVDDQKMPAGAHDGLQAARIARAAKISMQEGRPVKLGAEF